MEPHPQYSRPPRAHGPHLITMTTLPSQQHSDNDRSSAALDCNLTSLCDHIQMEGFSSGSFSDIVVHAMGSTYHLHRLILSRSPYFRNMLHGPWKEASSPIVTLQIDDKNVNAEAIAMALAYLYGHHPKLDDNNAFRVLAVASFLDLQDLCAICTDFIISELWTSNFLAYQVFAESQDYGIHGERVRNACWGYLCQSGAMELKEVLPKLSSQTLHALLTSDELWTPSEEKRFELALYVCLAKSSFCNTEQSGHGSSCAEMDMSMHSDSSKAKGKNLIGSSNIKRLESDLGSLSLKDELEGHNKAHNLLVELVDDGADPKQGCADYRQQVQRVAYSQSNLEAVQFCNMKQTPSRSNSYSEMTENRTSCSCVEMPIGVGASGQRSNKVAMEGLSEESLYHFNDNNWLSSEQSRHCPSLDSSCNRPMYNEWGRCTMPPLSWGGRVVGKREVKGYTKTNCMEDYDTFINIFEGGSLLYCNMSFEALLNVRNHLEELGFPCKAVNDGLWLQMLLSQRVQEIGADTCKICCCTSMLCNCRQPWPPTRFVFSRVPFGMGNRNCQQSAANDDSENRNDHNGDMSRDGLTALVGLSQGGSNTSNVHGEHIEQGYETDAQGYVRRPIAEPSTSGISVQMLESPENAIAIEWENTNGSFISLDMKTPLSHFPPFRFGVLFEDAHTLSDGQVKHSPEFFYAGSLWKVSVQAFNDEDPQGRRTLGLFLHRRKAEIIDSLGKVHMYVDSREKVTARYQLICPSKREVMVFGSYKQRGTLLPKAPKGWGWRTALLFDELAELLQNGTLRVAAIVQLV